MGGDGRVIYANPRDLREYDEETLARRQKRLDPSSDHQVRTYLCWNGKFAAVSTVSEAHFHRDVQVSLFQTDDRPRLVGELKTSQIPDTALISNEEILLNR